MIKINQLEGWCFLLWKLVDVFLLCVCARMTCMCVGAGKVTIDKHMQNERMKPSNGTMEECLIHYARKWIVTINTT